MRRRRIREITRKEWTTSLTAAVAGVVNAAGLMVLITPALLGLNSFWEAFALTALLGALAFPPLVVRLTNAIATGTIAVTSRNGALAETLAPLVREYGLASVTTPLGIALALVLWLTMGVYTVPALLIAVDRGDPFALPHLGPDLLVGYLVYGLSLGGFYGLIVQEHGVRRRIVAAIRPSGGA